ncbi:MAG: hypothetical protein J6S91_04105 [Treponema sp.]|nr:hypothetical protein [Treponema sp.]
MKRILAIAALLLTSVSLFAAKPMKVVDGSLAVLKENAKATWKIDLSKAVFENDGDFKTWCGADYNDRVKIMNDTFFASFNKYSEGLKLVDKGKAPYKVVLKGREFERKLGGMMGSAYIKVYGDLEVINVASGKVELKVELDGQGGAPDFVETDRFGKTMDWLCMGLFKLKK